jgi:integrase
MNYCDSLKKKKIKDIKLDQMQEIIDKDEISFSYRTKIKTTLSQVFAYAVAHDIISESQNKTKHIKIGKEKKSDKHYRFSKTELDTLWNASSDDGAKAILMMIYSGARPGEIINLEKKEVNLEEGWFSITEGKNENAVRKVPIHHQALPFFEAYMKKKGTRLITGKGGDGYSNLSVFKESVWRPTLEKLGIPEYTAQDGTKRKHLPHDTRHTFASMWAERRLNEIYRRKIQGHSGDGIGEQIYTHIDISELKTEIDKL